MPKTFASLFSGGGGADLGAIAAGLTHLWGLEYDLKIAKVYERNIGDVHCLDILDADPTTFERPNWLHASPVCKAFSAANANKGEKDWDIRCGHKVAEFIEVLQPQYFSLENVRAYRDSRAFQIIVEALNANGYHCNTEVINAADYGVPQSRERLFTVAYRGDFRWGWTPFTGNTQRMGWYQSIADLLPNLPESKLADWQIKVLPEEIKSHLLLNVRASQNSVIGIDPKASSLPSFTIPATVMKERPKALLIESTGARSDRPLQTRESNEPCWTLRAMGQDGHWHKANVLERSQVVQLDIQCLARLQGFPDSYQWSGHRPTDGTIIGNSVCPPVMKWLVKETLK